MFRLFATLSLCVASLAGAQDGTTLPPPPPTEPEMKPAVVEPVVKPAPVAPTARERRSGTVGVGYLGLSSMAPFSTVLGGGLGGSLGSLLPRAQVPLLGVRWWLRNSRVGIDVGLGAMVSTGVESDLFSGSPSLAIVAHLGLPIAVASTQHVIVLLAPEFRAGVSALTSGPSDSTGSLLELALRGGVELFFGFIGVPELSVEAAVRAGVAREAQRFPNFSPLRPGGGAVSAETFRFTTSLSGGAASIIASSLSLKYYF